MNRITLSMLTLDFSLAVVTSPGCTARVNPEQTKAVAEIERLGGKVTVDERSRDAASDWCGSTGDPPGDRRWASAFSKG